MLDCILIKCYIPEIKIFSIDLKYTNSAITTKYTCIVDTVNCSIIVLTYNILLNKHMPLLSIPSLKNLILKKKKISMSSVGKNVNIRSII